MKKLLLIATLLFILILTPSSTFAQGMMGNWTSSPSGVASEDHTAQEEAEGKVIWEKLQAKQLACNDLTDENYGSLGEYYMGQMTGNSHTAMNTMMERMMGKEGEEQMHVVMGKRLSGCNSNAQLPQSGVGFIPMMFPPQSFDYAQDFGGTKGGGNPMMGYGGWNNWNNMMGGWGGFGFGWIFMIVFWILIILGVIALVRYLGNSGKTTKDNKTPLEILKERYAKGEIDKKEFEEKKKDL